MNIRQAIISAAGQIDRTPGSFFFGTCKIPHTCGSPGCAIGWIAFYLGETGYIGDSEVIPLLVGRHDGGREFYHRMYALVGGDWIKNAGLCARGLRLYADKYHPAESRALIPENVRAIFDMTHTQLQRELA